MFWQCELAKVHCPCLYLCPCLNSPPPGGQALPMLLALPAPVLALFFATRMACAAILS